MYGLVFYIVISRNFLYDGGAFEHIFCPGGGEFEKSDFKKFKFPASARGGMLKFRIDRYIRKLAEENGILATPPEVSTTYNYITSEEMFQLRDVSPNEVRRIILETPSHKAPGPDKISFRFLKDSLEVILHPLTDIINCSLRSSKYPLTWKLAEVIPIHKDGDHEVASNNRPILLLAALDRL